MRCVPRYPCTCEHVSIRHICMYVYSNNLDSSMSFRNPCASSQYRERQFIPHNRPLWSSTSTSATARVPLSTSLSYFFVFVHVQISVIINISASSAFVRKYTRLCVGNNIIQSNQFNNLLHLTLHRSTWAVCAWRSFCETSPPHCIFPIRVAGWIHTQQTGWLQAPHMIWFRIIWINSIKMVSNRSRMSARNLCDFDIGPPWVNWFGPQAAAGCCCYFQPRLQTSCHQSRLLRTSCVDVWICDKQTVRLRLLIRNGGRCAAITLNRTVWNYPFCESDLLFELDDQDIYLLSDVHGAMQSNG